jgi:acetyl-CoA synthetase
MRKAQLRSRAARQRSAALLPLYKRHDRQAKGVVHTHGGYMVGTSYTHRICFDVQDDDIYWCTADPGWITGHSYVTYGPLINGATVLLAEGALDFPDPGRWWSLIQRYGVTIFYSTPTPFAP